MLKRSNGVVTRRVLTALAALILAGLACNTPRTAPEVVGQEATAPPTPTLAGVLIEDLPTQEAVTAVSTATETTTATATATATEPPPPTATDVPPVIITATPLPTSPPVPTNPPAPSDTPLPTATADPGQTPTSTTVPTATPTVQQVQSEDNLLRNPGFEGSVRPVIFGEINVFEEWEPFYCDPPYTPDKCPAPRPCEEGETVGCNPPDLKMRRPEFKPAVAVHYPERVHSGETAQQWFCFFGTCKAGVYQTFPTVPGQTCEVGAYIQSWSNSDSDPESELETDDDKANSTWQILVDRTGGTYAFADGLLKSQTFGFTHGIYDQYVKISFSFVATGNSATVFFMDTRIWPIGNNDSYIDDAYAYCD